MTAALAQPAADWPDGWYRYAQPVPSPNFGQRPAEACIDLAVIHSISLPPGEYGGDAIERLFTNTLDWGAHAYFEQIRGLEVSAHFLIRRNGALLQFVAVPQRAWHAGRSTWRGREQCNDYSVGIELEGLEGEFFTPLQYAVLAELLRELRRVWPITEVVGHEHVAPGRKQDPGPGFDWFRLARDLAGSGLRLPPAGDP